MASKRLKLPLVLIIISIIVLLGFKDTGIFVKEYMSIKEDGDKKIFLKEENVEVLRENPEAFIIIKDEMIYEVPKTSLIRTSKTSQNYKVISITPILDRPSGDIIRILRVDEILQIEKFEGEYGIFTSTDKISGYVKLMDLEVVKSESLSYGISKVNKVLKNENLYYVLIKGESVAIKDFREDNFIIINEDGIEFITSDSDIDLRPSNEQVTRSSISRRSTVLNKVIKGAYGELGKSYVYGGTGKRGYDCSGLVYAVYLNSLGIKLPRSSKSQASAGTKVARGDLIPGDIVLFNTTGKGISHAGLYIGDGNMIHASSGKRRVMIESINSKYYSARFVTARRIVN